MLRWWRARSSPRDVTAAKRGGNELCISNVNTATLATLRGGRYHVLELPVSLALLISELCRGLTWILCPNAMLLSADTSWIRWVCPSMLIKRAPSTALHLSATWGTHFWRERKIFVLWLTKILITTNVRLKKQNKKVILNHKSNFTMVLVALHLLYETNSK